MGKVKIVRMSERSKWALPVDYSIRARLKGVVVDSGIGRKDESERGEDLGVPPASPLLSV